MFAIFASSTVRSEDLKNSKFRDAITDISRRGVREN